MSFYNNNQAQHIQNNDSPRNDDSSSYNTQFSFYTPQNSQLTQSQHSHLGAMPLHHDCEIIANISTNPRNTTHPHMDPSRLQDLINSTTKQISDREFQLNELNQSFSAQQLYQHQELSQLDALENRYRSCHMSPVQEDYRYVLRRREHLESVQKRLLEEQRVLNITENAYIQQLREEWATYHQVLEDNVRMERERLANEHQKLLDIKAAEERNQTLRREEEVLMQREAQLKRQELIAQTQMKQAEVQSQQYTAEIARLDQKTTEISTNVMKKGIKFTLLEKHRFQTQSIGQDPKIIHFYTFNYVLYNMIMFYSDDATYDHTDFYYSKNTPYGTESSHESDFSRNLMIFGVWVYQANNSPEFPLLLFNYIMSPQNSKIIDPILTTYQQDIISNPKTSNLFALLGAKSFDYKRINSNYNALNTVFSFLKTMHKLGPQGLVYLDETNPQSYYIYNNSILNPLLFIPRHIKAIIRTILSRVDIPGLIKLAEVDILIPPTNKLSKTATSIVQSIVSCCGIYSYCYHKLQQRHPFYLIYSMIAMQENLMECVEDKYLIGMFIAMFSYLSPLYHYLFLGTFLHTHTHHSSLSTKVDILPKSAYYAAPSPQTHIKALQSFFADKTNDNIHYNQLVNVCALPSCCAALSIISNAKYTDVLTHRQHLLACYYQTYVIDAYGTIDNDQIYLLASGKIKLGSSRIPHPTSNHSETNTRFDQLHYSLSRFSEKISIALTPLLVTPDSPASSILRDVNWSRCTCCGYNSIEMPMIKAVPPTILPQPLPTKYKFTSDLQFDYQTISSQSLTNIAVLTKINQEREANKKLPLIFTPFPVLYTLPSNYASQYLPDIDPKYPITKHRQFSVNNATRLSLLWEYLSSVMNKKITPTYIQMLYNVIRVAGLQFRYSFGQPGHNLLHFLYNNVLIKQKDLLTSSTSNAGTVSGEVINLTEYNILLQHFEQYYNEGQNHFPHFEMEEKTIQLGQSTDSSIVHITEGDDRLE